MATIRSQMSLNDGMSGVLRKITSALDLTLASFEQVQRASGNAVNVTAIETARASLAEASRDVDEMADAYHRAAQQEEQLNRGIRSGTSAADGMLNKVKGLVATLGAAVGVNKLIDLSDQVTSTRARLSLIADDTQATGAVDALTAKAAGMPDAGAKVTMDNTGAMSAMDSVMAQTAQVQNVGATVTVDDGGSVEALEAKIMASAQRSRAAYLDTANAIASMGANAGNAFSGNDELIAFMEQVNKQFVIGGASAQGQSAAMLQLTQAMAAGALRGEELNSILENAPGIARAIESYMGIAEGSIKQYAEEGKITAEVVKNALFDAAEETNAKFESMPMTWGQIWTNMQNRALTIMDPILAKLNAIANSEQFSTVVDGALSALAAIGTLGTGVLDIITGVGSGIVDNWSVLEPIIWGLVAAFVAYNAVGLITNAVNGAMALSAGVKAAAEMMSTGTTFAATAAQHGLNAALLASPVTWIVIAVIALVAGLVALCNWIAKTTGVAQTGFGVITGGINVVMQFFVNLGLTVANIALGIWNALGACCSNIGIAFHNVIANVQGWFFGLLSTALTVVEGICAALNKLPFVEFDYSGITAKANEYAAKSAEAYDNVEDYKDVGAAFSEGFGTFDAFADGWASDAFQAGASWGDGVADKVSGMFDGLTFDPSSLGDVPGGTDLGSFDPIAYDDLSKGVGDISDNTGSMAKSLEISGEELEYLRDIAERDAINRFTTAEVKIDMTGMTNKIDGGADLDGVIRELTDGFTEALLTAAEGVHA